MSISSLLTIGSRAMTANYAALQVTGNNIANANTPGYSRQNVVVATSLSQQTGAGFFGKGVDVTTVTRAHSDFLTHEAATTASLAAADESRNSQLQQLEKVFQTGEAGLGYAAQQVFNSFVDVANKPQDSSARQVALARIGDFAADVRHASDQIDSLQAGIAQELRTSVGSINALTRQIAGLNTQIANVLGSGHAPNDLLDQRDEALNNLSKLVQVSTVGASDGTVSVFLGGSQRLVVGGEATPLAAVPDVYDPSKLQLGIKEGAGARAFPDGFVAGGSVAGLLRVQNHDLGEARGLLGQLATGIAGALNAQQALGLDLGQPPSAGGPLLSVGAPQVSASYSNAMSGGVPVASYVSGGQRVSSVSIQIVDAAELQPSDYELTADPTLPAGSYRLTRLSDGAAQTVSSGAVVDGFRITVATPLPAARDHFLLQPVSGSTRTFARALDNPNGIAAASPFSAVTGSANKGTAAVAALSAVAPSFNTNLAAAITFTDDSGSFSYSLVDATGVLPTVNGTGTFVAGQPIALNGFELRLSGVPKSGDTLAVTKTAFPSGDNGNANAMLDLRDAALIGQQTLQPGGRVVPGVTATDAYADLLATIGVRVQSAGLAADQSSAVAADAKTAATQTTGVNLDEEAARLIQYQQSYQAAAKMLQVAQSVFDTILNIGR